ncbi:l- type ii [Fusarium austroafricanum]|uniref:L- type ii n=1 Tax=Fusarium austroafricanum TaxID=2364996 RepID=A0A8H4KUE9_9HYPO|nr:l- type ii [Fusarium austroafricanum]
MELFSVFVCFLSLFIPFPSLPKVVILHLGGTISGVAESPTNTTHYVAGAIPGEELVEPIRKTFGKYVKVASHQMMSIDSIDLSPSDHFMASQRINQVLRDPNVIGVMVVQGSSSMAEFVFFQHLTVESDKPVVNIAAIKPHSAYDADGPQNMMDGFTVTLELARSKRVHGVVLVMGGEIWHPWGLRKENDRFTAGPCSLVGKVEREQVIFYDRPGCCYTPEKLDISGYSPEDQLRHVDLKTVHSGFDGVLVNQTFHAGVRVFVLSVYDDGYIPTKAARLIETLIEEHDILVVAVGYNPSTPVIHERVKGVIPGFHLDPRLCGELLKLLIWNGDRHVAHTKYLQASVGAGTWALQRTGGAFHGTSIKVCLRFKLGNMASHYGTDARNLEEGNHSGVVEDAIKTCETSPNDLSRYPITQGDEVQDCDWFGFLPPETSKRLERLHASRSAPAPAPVPNSKDAEPAGTQVDCGLVPVSDWTPLSSDQIETFSS